MRGNIGARNRLTAAKSLFDEGLIDESNFKKAKADLISTVIASDGARESLTGAREKMTAAKSLFDEGLIDESDFKKAKADLISTVIASD